MEYKLIFQNYSGIFALPTQAADQYINEASANDLKVLLYVFRHSGEPLSVVKTCEVLALTSEQLRASLDFWQSRGMFSLTPLGAKERQEQAEQPQREQEKTRAQTAAHKIIDSPTQYGQEEIAKKSQSNAELKFLLEAVPGQLGRLISPTECSTLVYLYEGAGLPADVIIMLVGYCVSCGKGNMRYIEKMAVSWAEEGIDTHERAESKIRELEDRRGFEGQIRAIMGINDRALTPTERQHIARWSGWKMPTDLVKQAYDIGVARTGKLSFSYINSILNSWHEKGFTKVEQARNENKQGKGTGGKSPSYDIDEYVRLSMKTLHNE
jgi:DnaD/phage-associated family protein